MSSKSSPRSQTTSANGDRHTKFSTRNAGIKNVKRPFDRSLNRQTDQKISRKNGFFLNQPQDDLLAEYDYQGEHYGPEDNEDEAKYQEMVADYEQTMTKRDSIVGNKLALFPQL